MKKLNKDRIEEMTRRSGLSPETREAMPGGLLLFMADGFVNPPYAAFQRFGLDAEEFPHGAYVTFWWLMRDEERLVVAAPLFFQFDHDVATMALADRKRARLNKAREEARKVLRPHGEGAALMAEIENAPDVVERSTKPRFDQRDWDYISEMICEEKTDRTKRRSDLEKQWQEVDRQIAMEPDLKHKTLANGQADVNKRWMAEMELPLQAQALEVLNADVSREMFPSRGKLFQPTRP